MDDNKITKKEIREYIWSEYAQVRTEKDQAQLIVSNNQKSYRVGYAELGHIMPERRAIQLEDTQGGASVIRILEHHKLHGMDKATLYEDIKSKFISHASGNVSVIFTGTGGEELFKRHHLPQILSNEKITSVNHIEKRIIQKVLDADQSIKKAASLERISLVLQGKEDMSYLLGNKKGLDPEIAKKTAIELSIEQLDGKELRTILEAHVIERNRLSRALFDIEVFKQKVEMMGWRAKTPLGFVKVAVEKFAKYRNLRESSRTFAAVEDAKKLRQDWLKEPVPIAKIGRVANELLLSKGYPALDLGDRGVRNELSKAIDKYIDRRAPEPVKTELLINGSHKWALPTPHRQLNHKGRKI